MHMADALLSPAVGITMCAASTAAIAYSTSKIKKDDLGEKKIPIMGVMGAFVFAAQMINFTIPAVGSSGHIGGGILLAATLGGGPALLAIATVLIIQCLFFADGGLLALGCNIFNMGVIPCLVVYPLLFKPLVKNGLTFGRITLASMVTVIIGLQLGAFGVVLETQLSGITALPFETFAAWMLPIHLAIGIAEGIITAGVLCFVYKMRPEIMDNALDHTPIKRDIPMKNILICMIVLTLIVGGGLSLFASSYPDGLEWAIEQTTGAPELETTDPVMENAAAVQEATAFMPDYDFGDAQGTGTSVAGILGGMITFALAGASALVIYTVKKRRKDTASTNA